MSPDEVVRAMVHYGLSVMGPTRSKVVAGTEWFARDADGTMKGHGPGPAEAVEAAVASVAGSDSSPGDGDDWDFLD